MSVWDWIKGTIQDLGATPEIAQAVAVATAAPTLVNIQRVEQAYRDQGSSPPPQLLNYLYNRYYETFPSTMYPLPGQMIQAAVDWGPIVLIAAVALIAARSFRRR